MTENGTIKIPLTFPERGTMALTGMVQWAVCHPANPKVAG